tara:strand:+ start:430 stop:1086 length:657 start_codon:yes stop_codon:yes gene_type:complete
MNKTALILAAGFGNRMKASVPKQFLLLNNRPILMQTIKKFADFDEIVVVINKSYFNFWDKLCVKYNFTVKHTIVAGGKNRFNSVKNGLSVISDDCAVAIHDGVRPFVSKILINNIINKVTDGSNNIGIIPTIPVKDSICVHKKKFQYIDRKNIFLIQTPQCFYSINIKKAYQQKYQKSFTDDASVFIKNNGKVETVLGEETNIKITTKEDLKFFSHLI